MRLTVHHVSRVVVGLGVAAALAISAFVGISPASGYVQAPPPRTITVTFTTTGPTPATADISSGDSVRFLNHASPTLRAAGISLVRLKSVTVTITGATHRSITLPPDAARTAGPYVITSALTMIRYHASYTAAGRSAQVSGRLSIGQAAAQPPPCPPAMLCPMQR
jgi:hypothetical protein